MKPQNSRRADSAAPLDNPTAFAAALREGGLTGDEIAGSLAMLAPLRAWTAPANAPDETALLVARLAQRLPRPSPVRQALQARPRGGWSRLRLFLTVARCQARALGWPFWLLSAGIALLGALALSGAPADRQALLLRIVGPLLAYAGTVGAFRSTQLQVLELELACAPSARRLTLAHLVVVLGYDVVLGLALSLVVWDRFPTDGAGLLTLTLSWLAPLLLVAGAALLLALRLPVGAAAGLAYGGWLAMLAAPAALATLGVALPAATMTAELGLGLLGLLLLAGAVLRLPAATARLLPA